MVQNFAHKKGCANCFVLKVFINDFQTNIVFNELQFKISVAYFSKKKHQMGSTLNLCFEKR